jgi:hypothetical protein
MTSLDQQLAVIHNRDTLISMKASAKTRNTLVVVCTLRTYWNNADGDGPLRHMEI